MVVFLPYIHEASMSITLAPSTLKKYLTPPPLSTAKQGIGTYQNYIQSVFLDVQNLIKNKIFPN